jgi:hypothetical protein
MPSPSFNTFRKINYNNPQYQQAMLDKQNSSDYSVVPNTRAITDQYTKTEANRIRGLDEFGIANRLAQEGLDFNKRMQQNKYKLALDELALKQRGRMAEIGMDRNALSDAGKGADLGMLIGLAQGGMNMYDNAQEKALRQAALDEQQIQNDWYLRQIADRTTAPAQGIAFDPSLNHKILNGGIY